MSKVDKFVQCILIKNDYFTCVFSGCPISYSFRYPVRWLRRAVQNILEAAPKKGDLLSSLRFFKNSTSLLYSSCIRGFQNILEAAPKKSDLLSSVRFLKNSTSLRNTFFQITLFFLLGLPSYF